MSTLLVRLPGRSAILVSESAMTMNSQDAAAMIPGGGYFLRKIATEFANNSVTDGRHASFRARHSWSAERRITTQNNKIIDVIRNGVPGLLKRLQLVLITSVSHLCIAILGKKAPNSRTHNICGISLKIIRGTTYWDKEPLQRIPCTCSMRHPSSGHRSTRNPCIPAMRRAAPRLAALPLPKHFSR